jgi:hypothetical protein
MILQCGAVIREIPDVPLTEIQRQRWKNWIAALKSGAYRQAKGILRKGDTYCCMGVACDLISKEGWIEHDGGFGYSFPVEKGEIMSTQEYVLPTIRRMYGGMGPLGIYVGGQFPDGAKATMNIKQLALTGLNDMGATFDEIAEILTKAMCGGYSYKMKSVELAY